MKKHFLAEVFGWYGMLAVLGMYLASSFGYVQSSSALYQIFNLTGAIGCLIISWLKRVWSVVALNVIWGIIAIVALFKIFLH